MRELVDLDFSGMTASRGHKYLYRPDLIAHSKRNVLKLPKSQLSMQCTSFELEPNTRTWEKCVNTWHGNG